MLLQDIVNLSYYDYVHSLLKIYGPATCDYFINETCRSKSPKISRTNEGLFCHHIDEDKEILLSTPEIARQHPFDYQKHDHLVYCNLIEHLLLHIKIVEENYKSKPHLGVGGIHMITSQINEYFERPPEGGWNLNAYNAIKEHYDDYIKVLIYAAEVLNKSDELFGYPIIQLCLDVQGHPVLKVFNDLKEATRHIKKPSRLYVGDKVVGSKIGASTIIAILKPDIVLEPVLILENELGKRQASGLNKESVVSVLERKEHLHTLYPDDMIMDPKYGEGKIKDIALNNNGDVIISALYYDHFCVYINVIDREHLIEDKKIIPKQ